MNDNTIKLQAFLSRVGVASRRASEKLIEEGKVTVNDSVAHIGQRINPNKDTVLYKGEVLNNPENKRYFIVNKPVGYISTTSDELGRKNVLELLPRDINERLFPVGRLDKDSEGLLLLTNDGDLTYKLTHPKFIVEKTYHVFVNRSLTFNALMHLRKGVKLKDGFTEPAKVERLTSDDSGAWLEITITEGRNRQVRRMFERVGYPVEELVRMSMGPLHLDMLEGQQIKEVSKEEIDSFFHDLD
jgi:pseudouridine synthase